MNKKEIVRCKRKDCFANMNYNKDYGLCKILNDSFDYKCPFFKTKKQYNDGIKKYGGIIRK